MTKAFEGLEFRYGVVEKMESGQEALGVSWKVNVKARGKRGVLCVEHGSQILPRSLV